IRIEFGKWRRGAIARLAATEAGNPEGGTIKRLAERDQLSDMTAGMTRLNAFVKAVETEFCGVGVYIVLFGTETTDFDAETLLGFIDEIDRFLEKTASFQRDNVNRQAMGADGG